MSGITPHPITKKNSPILYSFKNNDDISRNLADFVIKIQDDTLNKKDNFKVALSGGSLPSILAKDLINKEGVQWDKW
jgi:6-phosphogluconolactonase